MVLARPNWPAVWGELARGKGGTRTDISRASISVSGLQARQLSYQPPIISTRRLLHLQPVTLDRWLGRLVDNQRLSTIIYHCYYM